MIVVYGVLTLLLNFAADVVYGWLDPRVRHE
jgi:ABC-type dipeptide/oligopeptide/nickel transport system permease component